MSGVVGRGQQHQRLRRHRQGAAPVQEGPLDPVGQGQVVRHGRGSGELRIAELSGQLHQRERVTSGAGSQDLDDAIGDRPARALVQQGADCVAGQPFDAHQLDVGRREGVGTVVTGGEQHEDRFGEQPARGELQRVRGGGVQPLRVVDEAQDRRRLGHLGEQRQRRQGDEERVDLVALGLPEGLAQRLGLRRWDAGQMVQDRAQQPVQCRERQRRLRLEPCCASTRTCASSALAARSASNADFPTPAPPVSTRHEACPARAASSIPVNRVVSRSRP